MSAPHPTPAGSEERLAAATQPAPSAGLTEEEREHIHAAIDMLGDYEATAREHGNDSIAAGAGATRYVLEKLFRFLPSRIRAAATQGAPTPAQAEWHLVERDGMPPCDSETVFTGINTAGFPCCFNEVTHDGVCTMQGPELSTIQMSALRWWRVLDRPAAGDAGKTGESAASSAMGGDGWDASQIKPPGWDHVFAAFVEGAREARANPEAGEEDFRRAADGHTKRVFEEVDPVSEAALRTESWKRAASPSPSNERGDTATQGEKR